MSIHLPAGVPVALSRRYEVTALPLPGLTGQAISKQLPAPVKPEPEDAAEPEEADVVAGLTVIWWGGSGDPGCVSACTI